MTHDPFYDFLYYGAQFFTTFFALGVAAAILDAEQEDDSDDDDDFDGGIHQPCYVTK